MQRLRGLLLSRRLIVVPAMWLMLPLTGCSNVKWSATVSCSENTQTGVTTCTESVTVGSPTPPSQPKPQLALSDFEANPPQSFTVIGNAPASNFVVNTSTPAQSTFTAITDTGYTATVTVDLQRVTSTTAPVNPGDAVFTWAVVNSPQLQAWVANVQSNTVSTLQLSGSNVLPLLSLGNAGTYTITGEINANSTGVLNAGSSTIGITSPCGPDPHVKCTEPPGE
jgi:hypothetical protein